MEKLQKAILKTLAYADVFGYPLISKELYRFLIADEVFSSVSFRKVFTRINVNEKRLPAGKAGIDTNGKYFFLRGRKGIVSLRKKREKWSQNKLQIAQKVAKWLKTIPFIKMVAVTGNLAMNNSDKDDDIDLLIITGKNRLWLTRFLTVLLVELVANRRRPGDKDVEDKICLNMFLAEDCLRVPEKEQDLFSAHEVCQLKPIWSKNNVYQEFITQNQWYQKFLPNWKP